MKNASRTAVARTSLRGRSGISYDAPLSIGQTAELGKETSRHPRWSCLEARGCNCICILPAAAEEKRLAIESDRRAAPASSVGACLEVRRRSCPFVRIKGEPGALRPREPSGCPRAWTCRASGRGTP